MSVIVSRALPDVRDGLKPVHRRILYAMHELGLVATKPYKKCARVVGEVLGKFHPHGDNAVYDSLVRLAQDFSMRVPLVQGHGNFGSVDADPAAAMRYTECRLAPAAEGLLLGDLGAATVEWRDTFDASQQEPVVLPAVVPNLLVNGSQGIAVGLASTIPPHNLGEVVAALRRLIANPEVTTEELMECVRGPDYPTGGQLITGPELLAAYRTGRGSAAAEKLAQAAETADGGPELIVITELPYSVCKVGVKPLTTTCQRTAHCAGVADVRDESDRTGMRVVVEVKMGWNAELLLAQLFKDTRLQVCADVRWCGLQC
eukprot:XP_001692279.1 predicted protein [Chlamydomonas reinhardtii]